MTTTKSATQNSIVLTIYGKIPAFKNKKRSILDRNTGKQRTLTDPKTKQWMEACIQDLASQLLSMSPTTAGGTLTGCLQQFLIASVPQDDSWHFIPEIHIRAESGGVPGAEITITKL